MSIAVEDWDDLADGPRRRGGRGQDAKRDPSPAPAPDPAAEPSREREPSPVPQPSAAPVREPSAATVRSAAPASSPMRARITARAPSDVPPADTLLDWDEVAVPARKPAPAPEPAPEPEPTLGVANFADDHYGNTFENLRIPAGIAGANALFWLVGRTLGVVELVGVAFFVSIGLLLAAYILREWQRDRTALICLAGSFPLPLTIIGLFV